jgi:hypothetical protein
MVARKRSGIRDWGLELKTLLCVLAGVVLLAGCGRGGLPFGRVAGQVTLDGKPVKEGVIMFVPERGPSASGLIEHGQYSLTTRSAGDGAVTGKHRVYFGPKFQAAPPPPDNREGRMLPPPLKSDFPPPRYGTPESSGLTAEVQRGANTLDFNLSSK